ncbi:MAG: hypothetical protein JXB33_00070 [Clostridia bacterium]|nr:hypothetical protein [Clostridia bacterium]
MWPVNILFFLFPSIVIILIFFLLPFIGRRKEPFGYRCKPGESLDDARFLEIKNVYLRKVFLFSIPFSLAITISNIYILSTFMGTIFLSLLVFGLAGIDFLFFMHGYKAVKAELEPGGVREDSKAGPEDTENNDENKLPQW